MAILIPSKNIYGEIQNPKVRDNVIERIDVVAVEVLPNNDYETPVYNENFDLHQNESVIAGIGDTQAGYHSTWDLTTVAVSGSIIFDTYATISEIKIRKNENNRLISKLLVGIKKNGSSYTQISKNFSQSMYKYTVKDGFHFTGVSEGNKHNGYFDFYKIRNYNGEKEQIDTEIDISDIKKLQTIFTLNGSSFDIEIAENNDYDMSTKTIANIGNDNYTLFTYCNLSIDEPYKTQEIECEDGDEFFTIKNVKVLVARDLYSCASSYEGTTLASFLGTLNADIVQIKQEVKKAEITIYGNTIGIDLQDKTVYINGETARKVHSIDGNELMQTKNYIKKPDCKIKIISSSVARTYFDVLYGDIEEGDNLYRKGDWRRTTVHKSGNSFYLSGASGLFTVEGEEVVCEIKNNSLSKNFTTTRDKYKNGKETAVIRCSISDYMDYSTNEKVISIDGAKKCFELYDEVIPMIYGADGVDKPMSLGNAGQAKAFTVIGRKIYYDGAVWQELTLQESETVYYISGTKTLQDLETVTLLSLNEEKLIEI